VLVFPDDGSGYGSQIDKDATQKIKDWIERGGTFVGIGGGAFWATQEQSKLAPVSMADREEKPDDAAASGEKKPEEIATADDTSKTPAKKDEKKDEKKEAKKPRERMKIEEQEAEARKRQIPGTILAVDLDPAHPLAFGYDDRIYVLKSGPSAFNLVKQGFNVGSFLAEKVSGYISKENEEKLSKKAYLVEVPMGRGHVVLYADDPTFRLFWQGLTRLFLNSILLLSKP
jgi:biotin protein ligase-like protein